MKTIGYLNKVCNELKLQKNFCIKCREVYNKIQSNPNKTEQNLIQGRKENDLAYDILTWVGDQHYGKDKRNFLKIKDVKNILEVSSGRPANWDKKATKRWEDLRELIKKFASEYNQDLI